MRAEKKCIYKIRERIFRSLGFICISVVDRYPIVVIIDIRETIHGVYLI